MTVLATRKYIFALSKELGLFPNHAISPASGAAENLGVRPLMEITAGKLKNAQTELEPQRPSLLSEELPRKKIRDSWQRCYDAGLDHGHSPREVDASSQEMRELLEQESFLLHLVRSEFPKLQKQLPGDSCLLGFANRNAVLIEVTCPNPILRSASRAFPGSCWQEKFRGTNAIGTTAFTREPIAVSTQEHFLREYAALTCIAAPVSDPDGEVLGIIHLSSNCLARKRHSMALLRMSATHIESEIFKQRYRSEILLQFHSRDEFANTLDAGLIALNEDGQVISSNRQAQFLLEGLPLHPGRHFDEIFRGPFEQFVSRPQNAGHVTQLVDIKGSSSSTLVYLPDHRAKSLPRSPNITETRGRSSPSFTGFVCSDPVVANAVSMASRAVSLSVPILIRGETGTGKEMLAQYAHRVSGRSGAFVAVNCAAVPESLIEAELFGYRDGAFTGARSGGAEGLILQANKGTLFLDEIGDMPLNLQPALLRFLDSWTVRPIGSSKEVKVDVQLITATNCDLEQAIAERRFRRDLLHRINGVELLLPPLRERSDFDEIVTSILTGLSPHLCISKDAVQRLREQPLTGNVRELKNILLRAVMNCSGPDCSAAIFELLMEKPLPQEKETTDLESPLLDLRRSMILAAYKQNGGNISKVAQHLRVSRNTVYRELRQSGIFHKDNRDRMARRPNVVN